MLPGATGRMTHTPWRPDGRDKAQPHMKLKLDATGNAVLQDVNGVKMPVYVHDDGKESPFDAAQTVNTISRLNAEAKSHREKAEEFGGKLKTFEGLDPAAAREALEKLKTVDLKKLVDAGEVDKVRKEVEKVYELRLADIGKEKERLVDELFSEKVGGQFTRSKTIAEKFSIPADLVQARFGEHFGLDGGKIYATDAQGNKLYSRARPGELADFDEALMMLVDQYPYKDQILKGTGSSGGGAPSSGSGGGGGGKRTITRAQFEALSVAEKAAAAKSMELVD